MHLQIITPEKILFSADVEMVTIPGTEGEFGVLQGHAPFVSTLRPGIISIDAGSEKRKMAVVSGIAEVTPEQCTILAQLPGRARYCQPAGTHPDRLDDLSRHRWRLAFTRL